jgi:hypothetical protein
MSNEGELALEKEFQKIARNDFRIIFQVEGRDLIHGKNVVIDFMLYPKPHLINFGFDPVWFGVEIKHFGVPGETGKMSRFAWQCVTYKQSEFQIEAEMIQPAFVLGFSDVEHVIREADSSCLCQWIGMQRLVGLANVGMFYEIPPTRNNPDGGWRIRFSSSTYFSLSNGQYRRLKNYNIFKVNIGSC